jgi:TctA family transporter
MMEKTLRQALFITRGSVLDLVARPLTASILVVALVAFLGPPLIRLVRRRRALAARVVPEA